MHGSHNMNHVERGTQRFKNCRGVFATLGRLRSAVNQEFKRIRAKKRRNFKSDETPSF